MFIWVYSVHAVQMHCPGGNMKEERQYSCAGDVHRIEDNCAWAHGSANRNGAPVVVGRVRRVVHVLALERPRLNGEKVSRSNHRFMRKVGL